MKYVLLSIIFVALVSGFCYGGENEDFIRTLMNHKSLKHDHQFHPSPSKGHTDTGINPYHPYFHEHGNYGIHMHGGQYGHSKYKNYHYVRHFYWNEWREVRNCFPNGVYHMDDDNVMTMYSYCSKGVCYSFSISDKRDKYYFTDDESS